MRNFVLIVLAFVGLALAADTYRVETEFLCFTNETVAKADTLQNDDSAFCVVSQTDESDVLPYRVSIYLPNVLESGDSATIWAQELSSGFSGRTHKMPVNKTSRDQGNTNASSDNVRCPLSTGQEVFKSHYLGTYYYGDGGKCLTYSPIDSVLSSRVQYVMVEKTGTPIITGMDSLKTSPVFIQKIYVK